MQGFAQSLDPNLLRGVPKAFLPLYRQAYGETLLRYAPQQATLLDLLGQTEGDYRQKVAQANAASDLIQNAALSQQRNLPAQYQGGPLMGLLAQHGVDAATAAKYQITGYENQRKMDAAKVSQNLGELGGQAGTYFSTRADQLIGADRKQRHDTNLANKKISAEFKRASLTAQTSRDNAQLAATTSTGNAQLAHQDRQASIQQRKDAAAKRAAKKSAQAQFLPPSQQTVQVAKIKGAQKGVGQLMSQPHAAQHEVETLLRSGRVDGVKYTQPQIDIAFDLWRNKGKLSHRGVRVLHKTLRVQARGNFALQTTGGAAAQALGKVTL